MVSLCPFQCPQPFLLARPMPDIRNLTSALRFVVAVILCVVVVGSLGVAAVQASKRFAPEVQIQKDDYSHVRKQFHTTLTRKGSSPQAELMPRPPEWVQEIDYPSRDLRLKAWISGHQKRDAKLPAVLFLHGGFAFGPADWDMAVPYWAAGFVVMVPMLRGENGLP